ncbi:MAG: 3-deoxy-manno-octulosonate cytidylyltransferase [Pirellulales bacterium]
MKPQSATTSYVIIPARLHSTRLPRKMLLAETGKPMLQHTYEAARTASKPLGVCIATEDDEIAETCLAFGAQVAVTDAGYASGTDRIARVAREKPFAGIEIIVNVQGDSPEIDGGTIDQAIQLLEDNPQAVMATLACPIRRREELDDPACVKVVFDTNGRALYFSRAAVPHVRDWDDALLESAEPRFWHHVGIYAYRREFLLQLGNLPQTPLEKLENLEQLRVLENGHAIVVGKTDVSIASVDTPADYAAFVARQGKRLAA